MNKKKRETAELNLFEMTVCAVVADFVKNLLQNKHENEPKKK